MTYILRIGQDKRADRAFPPSPLGAMRRKALVPDPFPALATNSFLGS